MPTTPKKALSRRRALAALGLTGAALASATALSACSKDSDPVWNGSGSDSDQPPAPPKATVTIESPKADAEGVPASTEIKFATSDAVETKITLVEEGTGKQVTGAMHPDGTGWLPAKSLKYDVTYTVKVESTGDDGKTAEASSTFTTMPKPSKVVSLVSFLGDGAVFGTGMPLIFRTSRAIPKKYRAELQRRMIVETEPFQEGIWSWYSDTELHWRPREYWKSGTKVFVNVRAGGLPLGDGYHGKRDSTLTASAGRSLIMTVNDDTSPKVLKVVKDGKLIRSIPVSLGKPTWESSSGTMVIIERLAKTVFDTTNDPNAREAYRTDIEYAQRLTWGGEFIHAAPWSVQHQGKRNVSHGCINMSQANAQWLFGQTRVGDVVEVQGTPRRLEYGNGWTDWNKSWEEYVKGSAIPYQPPAPASESPSPDPSPTP